MGTSPLMALGVRAMAANYAALTTTGHNIANANVAGYSRQTTVLKTSDGQFTGAGFFGRGVDVSSVTRSHNEFLSREATSTASLSAMDQARLQQLKRLEGVFQPGDGGLGAAASDFFDAMVDLSSHPADLSTRQVVLARANDLVARFNEAGSALDQTQASVTAALKSGVTDVNQTVQAIAEANKKIAGLQGNGQPPNDLLDERDRLVERLSQQIQVTRIDAADGSVGLFVAGGQRLVLGAEYAQLKVVQDPSDPTRSAVAMQEGTTTRAIDNTGFGGGALAGLLRFQNDDLVRGRNLVGQLAAAVGGAVNAQQLRGINLQPPAGSVPSQPLFGIGAPKAIPQAGNAKDASGVALGAVTLTVQDPSALQASDYDLRESTTTPGAWQLTRLSDGLVRTVGSGDTVDGVQIDVSNAQAGDRFLLQPVARAANGMARLLDSPLDIAAASPLLATPAATNTGTASVQEIAVTANPLPSPGTSDVITFNKVVPPVNGNDYTYTSSLTGATTPWHTGQPVVGGNGYTLTMNGVPGDGDTVSVDPTPASSITTNNGNARALLLLRDATLVAGRNTTDAWSESLADIGVRVQSGQSTADISAAVAQQAKQQRSGESGVNLDEEAARLIQFQQSYQASAKVLQVAQSLFDTLLQVAGA